MSVVTLELDTKQVERMFRDMLYTCGPERTAKAYRVFLTRETGVLRRELRKKIAAEGPIGLMRYYRDRVISHVQGFGTEQVGIVEHDGVPYAPVINDGRRPGQTPPPARELVPWIEKYIRPTDENFDRLEGDELFGFAVYVSRNQGALGQFQPGQYSMRRSGHRGPGFKHYERTMDEQRPGIITRAATFFRETIYQCIRADKGTIRRG